MSSTVAHLHWPVFCSCLGVVFINVSNITSSIKTVSIAVYLLGAMLPNLARASQYGSCPPALLSNSPSGYSVRADLEYSAGRVADLYNNLPMVRLEEFPPRNLHSSEVQAQLDRFVLHLNTLTSVTHQLRSEEQIGFLQALEKERHLIQSFATNYSSFFETSHVHKTLLYLSNQVKGATFEGLVYVLLNRSGFDSIQIGLSKRALAAHYHIRMQDMNSKIPQHLEIDFVASKSGQTFWFEVKSVKPDTISSGPWADKEKASMLEQIKKLVLVRNSMGLAQSVQIVHLSHFNLGESFRAEALAAGADDVVFLRRAYLDELSTYK